MSETGTGLYLPSSVEAALAEFWEWLQSQPQEHRDFAVGNLALVAYAAHVPEGLIGKAFAELRAATEQHFAAKDETEPCAHRCPQCGGDGATCQP